jgi:L-threonylcarbamoyladenylate synthase
MQTTSILNARNSTDIVKAVSFLKADNIVALPTETVYGLAARAFSSQAVAKIFAAKNRPQENPLIWHVHNNASARNLFSWKALSHLSKQRFELLASLWPGPLTLVAQASDHIASLCNLNTVAVRVPCSAITLQILELLDEPLVMPSANISSRPSATCAQHVLKTLNGRIDAIVDAGSCEIGIESSVVRFDQEHLTLLRPGSISVEKLEELVHEKVIIPNPSEHTLLSPGRAFKHYAPRVAQIFLVEAEHIKEYWHERSTILARTKDFDTALAQWGKRPKDALNLVLPNEASLFAHNLYNALYSAEEAFEQKLVIVKPPQRPSWSAVHDRLNRAAELRCF